VAAGAWGVTNRLRFVSVRGGRIKIQRVFYPPCLKDYVFKPKRASPPPK